MLASNLVKPAISNSSGGVRKKTGIIASTPTPKQRQNQSDSGITSIVPDTIPVQRKAERTRRTVALRKKLVISDTDDADSSIPDEPAKVPSMESIPNANDSSGNYIIIVFRISYLHFQSSKYESPYRSSSQFDCIF